MAMQTVWRTVVEGISGSMAYIADGRWNLMVCNAEFEALFPRGQAPSNIMRWMLLDDEARGFTLTNWAEDWAPAACPALGRAVADRPDDAELIKMAAEVRGDSVVGPLYEATAESRVLPLDGVVRPIRHAVAGPGWVTLSAASPLTEFDARLVMLRFHAGSQRPGLPLPLSTRAPLP
ncbi:MmyB family transcriptional regulator [Streptomyces flavofungini]|uniref:MmyB-like transcription regulator ligand binding domain-containing protein n=1 Tax=Streptomyces flavofungini TaxID=68200 RepID=A0ABS0X9W6_9ACTN|nr:hypothetical protein [Streptomyces flavofungini]MBJ3809996.1 hypothetical protein [Streptomyces flavofungini]GHC53544.1 hypothetical protein GCM10010349_19650 [Streptomyces flavofungini]